MKLEWKRWDEQTHRSEGPSKFWVRIDTPTVSDSQYLFRRVFDYDLRPHRNIMTSEHASISSVASVSISIFPQGPFGLVFSRADPSPGPPHPLLLRHYYTGGTSNVYKLDRRVVLKTWLPGYADDLQPEVDIYQTLSKSPARSTFLGSFQHGNALILLLSDAGAVLESFDQPLRLRYVSSLILRASDSFQS
jgi:hypothetical protein